MTDSESRRAREWIERQLAELGSLRNASRRDQNFKAWRQHTLTTIQRIWPRDVNRMDRFRRIPFSPPMTHASERQVREYYERGWGEAGVLLRQYLAEIDLVGVADAPAGAGDGAENPGIAPLPVLEPPRAEAGAPSEPAPAEAPDAGAEDDIRRAMDRLLSNSPVFRGAPRLPAAPPAPESEPPRVRDLLRVSAELESLGVAAEEADTVREALVALARAPMAPEWRLVREALACAAASPALARRVVPLLLEYLDEAA